MIMAQLPAKQDQYVKYAEKDSKGRNIAEEVDEIRGLIPEPVKNNWYLHVISITRQVDPVTTQNTTIYAIIPFDTKCTGVTARSGSGYFVFGDKEINIQSIQQFITITTNDLSAQTGGRVTIIPNNFNFNWGPNTFVVEGTYYYNNTNNVAEIRYTSRIIAGQSGFTVNDTVNSQPVM